MARASIRSRRLRNPAALLAYLGTCSFGATAVLVHASGCGGEADAQVPTPAPVAVAAEQVEPTPTAGLDYDPRQSLAPLVEAVGPAVVSIHAQGKSVGTALPFFGQRTADGTGSGFILEEHGIVVTNHHVVDGARSLEVHLADGRRFDAHLLGSDAATDLAVLRIEGARELPTIALGESETLRVGDWVVAIGSPMGLEHSATVGIVSGRSRGSLGLYSDSYLDFLQTDADIAPGSSGGPLFDLAGRVVGITTAVGPGAGFAIPIDQAKHVIPQLRDEGRVVRGWLGAAAVEDDTSRDGARIGKVLANTPAEAAGLREGDVVTEVDGVRIESFSDLRARIANLRPGHTVTLGVRRGGQRLELATVLSERPGTDELARLRSSPHRFPRSSKPPRERESAPDVRRTSAQRLGVRARAVDGGLEILEVEPRSLGEELDLRPGDVVRRLNAVDIRGPSDVARALASAADTLEAELIREDIPHRIRLHRS